MKTATVMLYCQVDIIVEDEKQEHSCNLSPERAEEIARNHLSRKSYFDCGDRGRTQHSVWACVESRPVLEYESEPA